MHSKIQSVTNIFQIIAISVAGGWALTQWHQHDYQMTRDNVDLTTNASSFWSDTHHSCIVSFGARIENFGYKRVNIDSVEYEISKYMISGTPEIGTPVFVDPETKYVDSGTIFGGPKSEPLLPKEYWNSGPTLLISEGDPNTYQFKAEVKINGKQKPFQASEVRFMGCIAESTMNQEQPNKANSADTKSAVELKM